MTNYIRVFIKIDLMSCVLLIKAIDFVQLRSTSFNLRSTFVQPSFNLRSTFVQPSYLHNGVLSIHCDG